MFEYANLLFEIFVLECIVHFEFELFFGYDKCLYLSFLSIHNAYGGESAYAVVTLVAVKTDLFLTS